jgi:hypothetical protein
MIDAIKNAKRTGKYLAKCVFLRDVTALTIKTIQTTILNINSAESERNSGIVKMEIPQTRKNIKNNDLYNLLSVSVSST